MENNDSLFARTVRVVDQRDGKISLHSSERPASPTTGLLVPDNRVYSELQYLRLMERILKDGNTRGDRTGTGTHSIFGPQMTFDISQGHIPLLTTKKVNIRPIIRELLWFLSGSTNNNDLDAKIWDQWATDDGDLGPIYGKQWRMWDDTRIVSASQLEDLESQGFDVLGEVGIDQWVVKRDIDQVQRAIDELKAQPDSRRILISAWNPTVVPVSGFGPQDNVCLGNAALAACHTMVQFYTRELSIESRVLLSMQAKHDVPYHDWMNEDMDAVVDPENLHAVLDNFQVPRRALSSKLMQRSSDYVLGVPFNIASYAIFTQMIAQCVNMVPDTFIWTSGDTHIYRNQVEGALEQLTRVPGTFPIMKLNPERRCIDDFVEADFELAEYDPHPPINFGAVAV